MSEILDNIYIWVFLVNIESVLLLALVKYMLCSHFTQYCILLYLLEAKSPYFVTKNCWKFSYICVFILSIKRRKNPPNSGMVGRRKLPDPSLNRNFQNKPTLKNFINYYKSRMSKRTIEETTTTEFSFDNSNEQLRKKN